MSIKTEPLYHVLLENRLGIKYSDFIKDENRFGEMFDRLINAANAMQGQVGESTGINICIHVASTYVLLGTDDPDKYRNVEEELRITMYIQNSKI